MSLSMYSSLLGLDIFMRKTPVIEVPNLQGYLRSKWGSLGEALCVLSSTQKAEQHQPLLLLWPLDSTAWAFLHCWRQSLHPRQQQLWVTLKILFYIWSIPHSPSLLGVYGSQRSTTRPSKTKSTWLPTDGQRSHAVTAHHCGRCCSGSVPSPLLQFKPFPIGKS